MAAFLAVKERDNESMTCIVVFLISIFYIVLGYERVNDHGEFENQFEA